MNKIISIEVASQAFWVDEQGFNLLTNYFEKIRVQSESEKIEREMGAEIYKDIELRVAELLFEINSDKQKAISFDQVKSVVDQVGYIQEESQEESQDIGHEDSPLGTQQSKNASENLEIPNASYNSHSNSNSSEVPETDPISFGESNAPFERKSFRNDHNKILGGVCAGLSQRLRVPAFLIRLIFIGLTMFLGFGAVLYLIFWLALDKNETRVSALEADGIAPTASQIASYRAPEESKFLTFQRIIFLPISLLGALLGAVGNQFKKRKGIFVTLFKVALMSVVGFITLLTGSGLVELFQSGTFNFTFNLILSLSIMYMVMLGIMVLINRLFLNKSYFNLDKRLKVGAIIPAVVIVSTVGYMQFSQSAYDSLEIEKSFVLNGDSLSINFEEVNINAKVYDRPDYLFKVVDTPENKVNLKLEFKSYGRNKKDVFQNIKDMEFFYSYLDNSLVLDKNWTLKKDGYNRGQDLMVTIEVPQGIKVKSSLPLHVKAAVKDFSYEAYRYWYQKDGDLFKYVTAGSFIHEISDEFLEKLSENELKILTQLFCDTFYMSDIWSCDSDIHRSVAEHYRFDRAYEGDTESIDIIRQNLLPGRSLFLTQLKEIDERLRSLGKKYQSKSKLQIYVANLIKAKESVHYLSKN